MPSSRDTSPDLPQDAFAGLHPTYISLLERGLRNPSLVTVRVLAEALETTMTSLVRELETSP